MNKQELVNQIADSAGITRSAAERALSGTLDAIAKALQTGESVTLVGFGTFTVAKRNARDGRNPATGAAIKIPARKVVRFKPGSKLTDTVR